MSTATAIKVGLVLSNLILGAYFVCFHPVGVMTAIGFYYTLLGIGLIKVFNKEMLG